MTRNPGPSAKSLVRAVLQEEAPLSAEEILARCMARERLTSRNPLQTVRNALTADPYCGRTADGRYVYLPRFERGASVRLAIDMLAPEKRLLVTDQGAVKLLWGMRSGGESGPPPILALQGGPIVQPTTPYGRFGCELSPILEMPAPSRPSVMPFRVSSRPTAKRSPSIPTWRMIGMTRMTNRKRQPSSAHRGALP